jgi:hypothetical protein
MVARADGVVYEIVDGQAVLVDADGREMITLNPVGTLIWQALDGESDSAALVERLLPQLEGVTGDQLQNDVAAFLRELLDLGLATEPGG